MGKPGPSLTSEERAPFASVPTASGNAVRSLLQEQTADADLMALSLLGNGETSPKRPRCEEVAVTRGTQASKDRTIAGLADGTMSVKEFACAGREAGLSVWEVATALRARIAGACGDLFMPAPPPTRPRLGLRVVMLSDTHGHHRQVACPPGDVLLHAGDFTQFGREEDAIDFNRWLGELPHAHKFVVLGNHEANAPWRRKCAELLCHATLLCEAAGTVPAEGAAATLWGTDFFWPMTTSNPHYERIPPSTDIIIAHGPAKGHVDGGAGCEELLRACKRVRPRLVVSGHIHGAHGITEGRGELAGTTFVNAANAKRGHGDMGWPAVVVEL